MTKQKKGFLLFIASLIPGAGELYMGFRKMGLSLMILFWGVLPSHLSSPLMRSSSCCQSSGSIASSTPIT